MGVRDRRLLGHLVGVVAKVDGAAEMTICAAAIGFDGVWIGSDGHEQVNYTVTSRSSKKWTLSPCGTWALSEQGTGTNAAALEDLAEGDGFWPTDTSRNGVRELARRLRAGFLAFGSHVTPTESSDEKTPFRDWNWSPIVATPQGIWRICSDLWTVQGPIEGFFHCAGSGDEHAAGAIVALHSTGVRSAEQLVRAGVATACRISVGCGGEQWVHRMGARIAAVA